MSCRETMATNLEADEPPRAAEEFERCVAEAEQHNQHLCEPRRALD